MMHANDIATFAKNAEMLYDLRLKYKLEASHQNEFVAIEPVSGEYFLGKTLSEALGAARTAHPDRWAHAIRIGCKAALHFGGSS